MNLFTEYSLNLTKQKLEGKITADQLTEQLFKNKEENIKDIGETNFADFLKFMKNSSELEKFTLDLMLQLNHNKENLLKFIKTPLIGDGELDQIIMSRQKNKITEEDFQYQLDKIMLINTAQKIKEDPMKFAKMMNEASQSDMEKFNFEILTTSPKIIIENKNQEYDIFLSHAHEDKKEVAEPLYLELQNLKVKVWFDSAVMRIGDSLRKKIEHGLRNSKFAVVIASKNFFSEDKVWTHQELDILLSLAQYKHKIFPIWYEVTSQDMEKLAPTLLGKIYRKIPDTSIKLIAEEIHGIIREADNTI